MMKSITVKAVLIVTAVALKSFSGVVEFGKIVWERTYNPLTY